VTYRAEWLLVAHEIDDEGGRGDEEDLHERVVQADEVHKEVQVPNAKDYQVQLLSLAREAYIIQEPLMRTLILFLNNIILRFDGSQFNY
jgi:hypothetical protein